MKRVELITKPMESVVVDNQSVGNHAKNNRVEKGLSVRQVAIRMAISHTLLSDLEAGRRTWSQGLVDRFNKAIQ